MQRWMRKLRLSSANPNEWVQAVRLLLDTHVALWAFAASPRLTPQARALIADLGNDVYVSAASVWEVAIKHGLKRRGAGAMPISGTEALAYCTQAGYALLPVTPAHAAGVDALPAHHADPFDRILIAQARQEPLRLVTHDAALQRYDPNIIVV